MEQTFAVILMDVQMPVMDGYETARLIRLRDESEHTPIIFVTSHARNETQIPTRTRAAPSTSSSRRSCRTSCARRSRSSSSCSSSRARCRALAPSQQFRDSEARTRSVLENVADGIVTVSDEGVIESFNRAAGELFGYSEHEAVGQPFSTMVGPKHPGDFAERRRGRALDC